MDSGNENKVFSPFIHFFTQAIEQTQATFAQMSIQKKCAICDATQNLKMCGTCKRLYICRQSIGRRIGPPIRRIAKRSCKRKNNSECTSQDLIGKITVGSERGIKKNRRKATSYEFYPIVLGYYLFCA